MANERVWLLGSTGRMGKTLDAYFAEHDQAALAGAAGRTFQRPEARKGQPLTAESLAQALDEDTPDLVIDFSSPEANQTLQKALEQTPQGTKAVLIATTALSNDQQARWDELARKHGLRVLFAPNTSLGILLTSKMATLLTDALKGKGFDIEILETHHRGKADAPSGTARYLARTIAEADEELTPCEQRDGPRREGEIGVHALRGGQVFGEHTVRFMGDEEEITIKHTALSRRLFAKGAHVMGQWLLEQPPGVYGNHDIKPEDLA